MTDDRLSKVFSALADPTRRDIVARLATRDATVNELAEPYDVSLQAVSKHLKVLTDAGLVQRSRDAQRRPCHLDAEVFDLMTRWIERYRREAEDRYRRLDAVLEKLDTSSTERNPTQGSSIVTTTAKTNQTQIIAHPDVPAIVIIREFEAPPDIVFRAHIDPDLVVQWLGPRNRTMSIDSWEARTGGQYRYLHTGENGHVASFRGVFHEVRPPERIVQTFTYEASPDDVSLEKAIFSDLGGRTRLTSHSLMDSFERRDAMLSSGMEGGVVEGYERLDALLGRGVSGG